jgi:hypothetical protein
MSTIKVNSIKSTSTTDGGISIDTSGHVTVDGVAYPTAGPLSNRNLLINGAMQVAQRGTSFTGANGSTLDMWKFSEGTSAVFDVAQSSIAPAGFSTSFKVDCTTTGTPTGSQEAFVETKVESQNLQHLQYGTSGAQSMTLSFWVRSNKTGDYGLWIYHYDDASQYATTYTISSADTWEYKTITIPGNTSTALANDNTVGLAFRFYMQIGPDLAGTPSETWQTTLSNRSPSLNLGDSTSNEWLITGVQLEVGSVATPFEHRSYGDELAKCQRYYYKIQDSGTGSDSFAMGYNRNTTLCQAFKAFPVTMRTAPTAIETSGDATDYQIFYQTSDSVCSAVPFFDHASAYGSDFYFQVASGLTAGQGSKAVAKTADAYLAWSAEL